MGVSVPHLISPLLSSIDNQLQIGVDRDFRRFNCCAWRCIMLRVSYTATSLTNAKRCAIMNRGTVKFGARTIGNWKTIVVSGFMW